MKPVFKLVRLNGISKDTVRCLRVLLEKAERGEVIGVAYAAMYRQREYSVHTCGEMHRNPTFCMGAVSALGYQLAQQVFESQ